MTNSEQIFEQRMKDLGLDAPRLTPQSIEDVILKSEYYVYPDTQLTVCCIYLKNGFTVTGESACASPENFNEQIGQEIAFKQAKEKIWQLEGYLLKQRLFEAQLKD